MKKKSSPLADKIRKRSGWVVFVDAARAYLTALISLGLLLYLLLLMAFFFPQYLPFRVFPLELAGIFIFIPLLAGLGVAFFERRDTRHLTLTLERHYPHLGNRLLTAVELSEKSSVPHADPFSRALAEKLERQVTELMDRFQFARAISWKKLILPGGLFVGIILTGIVHASVQSEFFTRGFQRIIPADGSDRWIKNEIALPQFQIEIIPGDCDLAKGTHLLVKARFSGGYSPKQVELRFKQSEEPGWRVLPMTRVDGVEYQYVLTHMTEPGLYFVQADHQRSSIYQIRIFEQLIIERAVWHMEFPGYMNLPEQRTDGWKEKLTIPRGTILHLEVMMNRPVSSGWISLEEGKRTPLEKETERVLKTTFTANQDLIVRLDITGIDKESFVGGPPLWIQTLPDLDPYLEVLEPQLQNYAFPTEEIPFKININDDYGVQSVILVLHYQNREERIDWTPKGQPGTDLLLKPVLKLEGFLLHSRDFIAAHLEVRDNYPGEQAHIVKSSLFTFLIRDYVEQFKFRKEKEKLPSLRNLFEDILTEQEKIIQDSWDYISMPPIEAPKGWESRPDPPARKNGS